MENQNAGSVKISSISQLNELLMANKDKAIILTPFSHTSFNDNDFAQGFVPSLRSITVDSRVDNSGTSISGDVYAPSEKRGTLALTKQALDKIAMMAGITWKHVQRLDYTMDPFKCRYVALGEILTLDGMPFVYSAEYSQDLNDGSPQATSISKAGQLASQRKNIAMITESKAKSRVIRAMLGISHYYSPEELKKPFMILRVIPDMRDPEVARMVKAKMLGLERFLFPDNQHATPALPGVAQSGTHGLELAEPPGGGQRQLSDGSSTGTGPTIDVEATIQDDRARKIAEIEELYYTKTKEGMRDRNKPALTTLRDEELDAIIAYLHSAAQVRPPAGELI